jgi:pimeloyl-ACP methyl ester carboxylesterase
VSHGGEEQELGLRRVVVDTVAGPIVARIGRPADGRVVLLVHGAAGSWRGWLPVLRTAAAAGRPLSEAVVLDLPGWGESPDPARPLDASLAAEAVAQVARSVGAERWIVAGHSLGGVVALALARREPDPTEGVLLVSPTGPAVLEAIRRPIRGGIRLPWFAGMLLAMRILSALPGGGRPLLRFLGRIGLLGALAGPLFADQRAAGPQVLRDFGEEVRPSAFLRATRSTLRSGDDGLAGVRAPVRSVRGEHDVFVGRRDAADFARRLPDFSDRVVVGAGHFALAERPAAVLEALDELR